MGSEVFICGVNLGEEVRQQQAVISISHDNLKFKGLK